MVERTALLALTDGLLQPERFKDYCPNGLQVEGRPHVQSVASGVTASLAFIQSAIDAGADTLLVHHGLFWRNQTGAVTGWLKKRLALLLQHDINLLAYHLPLDAHPALGNNAQLAAHLGFRVDSTFGDQGLGFVGQAPTAFENGQALAQLLQSRLGKQPVSVVPDAKRPVRRIPRLGSICFLPISGMETRTFIQESSAITPANPRQKIAIIHGTRDDFIKFLSDETLNFR